MADLAFTPAQTQFIKLQQTIDRERIARLVEAQQQGKLSDADRAYYGQLIDDFIALVQLPDSARFAMQLLPAFKITVPALLDGMAFCALRDKSPEACVFAAFMLDQSLLQRDLSPLFHVVLEYGTPPLWVELVKKVNHAPAEAIVQKVYASDAAVQAYWEQAILDLPNADDLNASDLNADKVYNAH